MKVKKYILSKVLISFILSLFISVIGQNIYAYQIEHIAVPKDELNPPEVRKSNFPEMIYRKQVSAYADTITAYKSGKYVPYKKEYGWVYKTDLTGSDIPKDNSYSGISDYNHTEGLSFSRVYEYFHQYQNSYYTTESPGKGYTTRYYSTGTLTSTDTPDEQKIGYSYVWNVWGETDNYAGVYWIPASSSKISGFKAGVDLNAQQNIVIMDSNLYRFAVINDVYISDNYLTQATIDKIYERFKNNINNSGQLEVYVSSVLRTSSKNKKNSEEYYQNMDTAFKFWETTIRGGTSKTLKNSNGHWLTPRDAWDKSPSTMGMNTNATKIQPTRSVINYYDNTFVIPIGTMNKKVYVRHIDVSDVTNNNIDTIRTDAKLITGINNSQIVQIENYNGLIPDGEHYNFQQYVWPTGEREITVGTEKYNEQYVLELDLVDWIVGNVKYTNNSSFYKDGSAYSVSALNGTTENYTTDEKTLINDYNCVGGAVGYGDSLEEAVVNRNSNSSAKYASVGDFQDNQWQNEKIEGDSAAGDYIVIDFYYKKKPTEVYVRHIDITNNSYITNQYLNNSSNLIQTGKGKAFKLNPNEWEDSLASLNSTIISNHTPTGASLTYQEKYVKESNDILRMGNIRYDFSNEMSYWKLLSPSQQNTYNKYSCVGAAVGKAESIASAEDKLNTVKTENNASTLSAWLGLTSSITTQPDRYISKNSDWTSVVVNDNNYKYVVIDFYYVQNNPDCVGSHCSDIVTDKSVRKVYVRHVDVSGIKDSDITATTIKNAINNNNILPGEGRAKIIGTNQYVNKQVNVEEGYQELYLMQNGTQLEISKYNSDDYICIGSNITGGEVLLPKNNTSAEKAKSAQSKMDNRLNTSTKYSALEAHKISRKTDEIGEEYVTVIDFYYRSKYTGTLIERTPKGRLSFWNLGDTDLSGSSSTGGTVNQNAGDSTDVTDVIPSGESLKAYIANAPLYMLGGINIVEQTKEGTYTLNYTLTQKFEVDYIDWYGVCSSHGERSDWIGDSSGEYSCDYQVYVGKECDDEGKNCEPIYEDCGNTLTIKSRVVTAESSESQIYTYIIPYKHTYYKIKNMRLYTISKMELYDGYNNKGLPLFDGQTHTVLPTDDYKKSFSEATFDISSDTSWLNRSSKTLDTTLSYTYDNDWGDVDWSEPEEYGSDIVDNLFETYIDHEDAARMKSMDDEGNIKENDTPLTAIIKLTNDKVYFKDKENENATRIIVGENKNSSSIKEDTAIEYKNYKSEQYAQKEIDLTKYTAGKTRISSWGNQYTYTADVNEDKVEVSTVYPKSIRGNNKNTVTGSQYLSTSVLTTHKHFENKTFDIPEDRLNGRRYSYGKVYYNLVTGNNVVNFDVNDSNITNGNHNWNYSYRRTAVNGAGTKSFVDTEMHNTEGVANPSKLTLVNPSALKEIVWEYGKNNNGTDNKADVVNVFSPVSFTTWIVKGQETGNLQVNHSNKDIAEDTTIIQKNSRFTIAMKPGAYNSEYMGLDTDKYLMQYYVSFNFDVQDIKITDALSVREGKTNGRNYSVGVVQAGEWIGPIYNEYMGTEIEGESYLSAFALADPNEANINSVVNQASNSYSVRAVAYNAPNSLIYDLVRNKLNPVGNFVSHYGFDMSGAESGQFAYNTYTNTKSNTTHSKYYVQTNIEAHSKYIAELKVDTENLSRLYDFKVTDLKDLDWKNIFRKSTTENTNEHTSEAYYSGIKKWNIYTTSVNQLLTRDSSEIGATKRQTLPLGPYKNTNTAYIKAPKLGYKFSFDLKTTGAIDTDDGGEETVSKKVVIIPEFYYISKSEATGGKPKIVKKDKLKLYYKNSSNKYVDIKNYNLYFVPDDGYRLTFRGTDAAYRFSNSSLSKSTVKLGNTTELTLTSKMMEKADNMFVQIWYGEYKLPNSTIAVEEVDGKYDVNNPLKNGYIGVKFDIKVYEYNEKGEEVRELSYNQGDLNKNEDDQINTTQWDYEGYLGYDYDKKNGAAVSLSDNIILALENMTWKLDQEDYEFIRGTVILYDTDAKASSDYD